MRRKKIVWLIIIVAIILAAVGVITALKYYQYLYAASISTGDEKSKVIHIRESADFTDVLDTLKANDIGFDSTGFVKTSQLLKYPELVKPGRYRVHHGMNNYELVAALRGGLQDPVNVTINNVRTLEELSGKIAGYLELDSAEILEGITNDSILNEIGFTRENVIAMFIPNTYEMYWNLSFDDFLKRMQKENRKFWNDKRTAKAITAELTKTEVITLASIIEEETRVDEELPIVAGLYINRLNRDMLLQADPTVKFAVGNFALRRVNNDHLTIDSPYNTYRYKGLPPGPIRMPEIKSIDAVLNYERHDYIYMCAKADFSGEHYFAKTLRQHNANARKYREALNRNRIWR